MDPFELDDGAYVLGALSPQEHSAFEAHLSGCAQCRERVRRAREASSLLERLRLVDLLTVAPPPPLHGGLSSAAGRRRTRRRLALGVGGLAAAAVVAFGALVVPALVQDDGPTVRAMTPLVDTPVRASAALAPRSWGTEIEIDCEYDDSVPTTLPERLEYAVRVVARDGAQQTLGTWAISRGDTATYRTGTSLARDEIGSVEVVTTKGRAILSLSE
nr:zf-HC2 domain-containing protein [Motilibacter aurantiacus]